jgi:hypothetical protein
MVMVGDNAGDVPCEIASEIEATQEGRYGEAIMLFVAVFSDRSRITRGFACSQPVFRYLFSMIVDASDGRGSVVVLRRSLANQGG